jgi:SRSO17 transposase
MTTEIPGGADWHDDFRAWLEPFLAAFRRSEQPSATGHRWYLQGLMGPGHRKSVETMAERVCPGQTQQLHHFVSTSIWATEPLEQVLRQTADALLGGDDHLINADHRLNEALPEVMPLFERFLIALENAG